MINIVFLLVNVDTLWNFSITRSARCYDNYFFYEYLFTFSSTIFIYNRQKQYLRSWLMNNRRVFSMSLEMTKEKSRLFTNRISSAFWMNAWCCVFMITQRCFLSLWRTWVLIGFSKVCWGYFADLLQRNIDFFMVYLLFS